MNHNMTDIRLVHYKEFYNWSTVQVCYLQAFNTTNNWHECTWVDYGRMTLGMTGHNPLCVHTLDWLCYEDDFVIYIVTLRQHFKMKFIFKIQIAHSTIWYSMNLILIWKAANKVTEYTNFNAKQTKVEDSQNCLNISTFSQLHWF